MAPFLQKAGTLPAFLLLAIGGFLPGAPFSCPEAFAADQIPGTSRDRDWNTIQHTIHRGKWSLAEQQIGNYLKVHPENHEAYRLGGRIARKIHQPGPGIRILDQGIKNFPDDKTLPRLKAELLMEQGDMPHARKILSRLSKDPSLSSGEKKKIQEDKKTLEVLVRSMPPLATFDQNINFQEPTPAPFQSPATYALENAEYHVRVQNIDISYAGGSSIGTGIAVETPLVEDTVHFQAGTNLYVGSAAGQTSALESYLYAGVDGQGPEGSQYLLDAGDVFAGNQVNAGLYGHVDVPLGPLRLDGQGWYQLPWSGYGEAILAGGLQSGGLLNGTVTFTPTLSLSGEYEYTYDTLGGSQNAFGINHNTMVAVDWNFLKKPDLHFIAGYDTQSFTPFIPNPTAQVPVLLSSNFGFAGFSTLDQIGRYVLLNGQLGGVLGTFDTPGPLVGLQADAGASFQINPHLEFYANFSYESLAAAYIGAVTTMMFGINVWL